MNLESIVQELKKQRQYAADPLLDTNPITLKNRIQRKQNAPHKIADMFFDYRLQIRSRILPILVIGSKVDEFAEVASESKASLPYFEADALYEYLASKVDASLLKKGTESTSYFLDILGQYLEDTAKEIGIQSYPQLILQQRYLRPMNSLEAVIALAKQSIEEQVGIEMSMYYLLNNAAKLAFEEDFGGKVFPVLLKVRNDDTLKNTLSALQKLGNKSITVATEKTDVKTDFKIKEINEENVLEILTKIKTKLK